MHRLVHRGGPGTSVPRACAAHGGPASPILTRIGGTWRRRPTPGQDEPVKEFVDFLAAQPPYDALDPAALDRLARTLEVEYVRAGTVLLRPADPLPDHVWVVRSGALEVLDGDRVVDLLEQGDTATPQLAPDGDRPAHTLRAAQDSVLYLLLPRPLPPQTPAGTSPVRRSPVGRHARPVLLVEADEPVREVARRIGDRSTSCAVVRFPDGLGVVTDADVRRRVGTGQVPVDAPVARLASRPALCVPADADVASALLLMVRHGVHHLVVTDPGGRPQGVLRAVDLASAEVRDPLAVRAAVAAAQDVPALADAVRHLPAAAVELHDAGVPALRIASLLAAVAEAVVLRTVALGGHTESTGVRCSWIVLGSLARRELLPTSDVDTALAWDGDPDDTHGERVRAAAARTLDDLERAGLRRCPDGANADDPLFGRSVQRWRVAAAGWSRDPTPARALLLATMLASSRALTEPDLAAAATEQLRGARDRPAFRKAVLDYTLAARPPIGFVREFVVEDSGEHRGRLNLKRGGLRPITSIGTWAAVLTGAPATGTPERLRAALAAGLLDPDEAASLEHAYEYLFAMVLGHEVEALRAGAAPDTWIDPARLDTLTRRQLREAFRVIAKVQGRLESQWAPRWQHP